MKRYIFLVCSLVLMPCLAAEAGVLTRLEEVRDACSAGVATNAAFDVSGTLLSYFRRPGTREWIVSVSDGTNVVTVYELNTDGIRAESIDDPRLNDRVRLNGVLYDYCGGLYPGYRKMELLERRPVGADANIVPADMFGASKPPRPVRLTGIVRDALRDESDPNFVAMSLDCGGESALAMVVDPWHEIDDPSQFIGRRVAAEGCLASHREGVRRYAGRVLTVSGGGNIRVFADDATPDVAVPDIADIRPMPPAALVRLGRHKAVGTVRAAWHGNRALVETDAGEVVGVRLAKGPLPAHGARVRVVGFPETDIYFMSLVNAVWTSEAGEPLPPQRPKDVAASELLADRFGRPQVNIRANGGAFRLRGRVRYLPPPGVCEGRLGVESGGYLVSVDADALVEALGQLEIGCEVAVAGTCVVDTDGLTYGGMLPRARGMLIVPNDAGCVEILSRPPWWTPGRLLALVGVLAAALASILLWNIALSRRAERRGRELADERLGHVTSDLKVEERTRLAVELHDALSQTLAGVSMQVGAAKEFVEAGQVDLARRLDSASNAIDACRNELKNCIWDLRSEALEESTMDAAIRKTLAKDVRGQQIDVRFSVPRERISDNTAHAILSAVRELAVNAMCHGGASHVSIAGCIEGDMLMFSVQDDGCGFDPLKAPGIADGHFGMQGIRERFAPFGGTLEIDSAPGKGTKATIRLKMGKANERDQSSNS